MARADDRIVLGLDWLPQCEQGGFFEAAATGLYKNAGLDVIIRGGGPQVSTKQLLAAGAIDMALLGGSSQALAFVEQQAPFVAIAAVFQKDPQTLISHVGVGSDTLEQLKGKPIMISKEAWDGYWPFLKQKYGYTDDQIRAYTFDSGPFFASSTAIIQGYITNDHYILNRAGVRANIFLLADYGFSGYGQVLMTSRRLIDQKPDMVQRFVTASMAGWKAYLYGDPAPGDAAITHDNPDYSVENSSACREAILSAHLTDSGDAVTLGIGAMTEARWRQFTGTAIAAGLYPADLDWHAAFTTQFVNKGPPLN